ncbi:MazG nucleotide pyrophosphohydrolase domain-containing protein [Tunturiibacter gelidoferens]|uniref:NTP pyrophosphatase (Non-canonical NTP hydrolase) n=1 Tax=Tunturiibacter gelidiferens TaxID=3069689 RepID=A0ACC5P415_9BACT|nr:NTP pyrophosphatase (non-canonical NTP hydrolase) [Edaphobacter lichenicola]
MELKDICKMQSEFDAAHKSNARWDEPITQDNLQLLEHLLVCLVGEVGECANLVKKVVRGDLSYAAVRDDLGGELADTFIYLIKVCSQTGIDLEREFLKKLEFNRKRFKKYEA